MKRHLTKSWSQFLKSFILEWIVSFSRIELAINSCWLLAFMSCCELCAVMLCVVFFFCLDIMSVCLCVWGGNFILFFFSVLFLVPFDVTRSASTSQRSEPVHFLRRFYEEDLFSRLFFFIPTKSIACFLKPLLPSLACNSSHKHSETRNTSSSTNFNINTYY